MRITLTKTSTLSVLEYCSEQARIIPLWTVMLSYSLSSILTPVMSMYLSSWRALLAIATLPNFVVILADFFHLIPESLRWLLCKGRKDNALKLVQKIAKFNRVQLNVSITFDYKKTGRIISPYLTGQEIASNPKLD